ncbi:helix-turn-helix domain-containing protein [Streptomyces sindenensis]|uniref:Helix-turn-helix domain-containing protein n=1 Tax=Streptomyces sindenensis TaxID=67363 RepID=A0ABW6EQJ2_9ACTN
MRIRRERLRELRHGLGLTQSQVARALGCSRSAVSTLETKGRAPSPKRLNDLSIFYGVPISELVHEEEAVTLRSLRRRAGVLMREAAEALGVGTSTYCDVETRRQRLPKRWIPILSERFGVTSDDLHRLPDERSPKKEGGGAPE